MSIPFVRSKTHRTLPARSVYCARLIRPALLIVAAFMLAACGDQSTPISFATAVPSIAASPTPTIAPTLTPTIDCVNDAKFIADINVLDGSHFRPGTPFTKTWQLRNSGTCAWTIDYQLKFIGGPSLGGSIMTLTQSLKVSDTVELSIPLIAPVTAGHYRARWRLFAADGAPFGPTLFADIVVP